MTKRNGDAWKCLGIVQILCAVAVGCASSDPQTMAGAGGGDGTTDLTEGEGHGSPIDDPQDPDAPGEAGDDAAAPEARDGGTGEVPGDAASPPPEETSVVPSGPMPYRGVNLAGGEFGSAIPGRDGVDYRFPNNGEIDYFVGKGMNTFRFGFKWERLQPKAYAEFVDAYIAQIDGLVAHATSKGAFSVLNPHNFARYYDVPVGSSSVPNGVFADLWKRLAVRYKDNPRVMFNLVNEPRDMSTEQWVGAANAAIKAIRDAGANNTVIAPGNGWTGAHSWSSNWYGTSNAVAMLKIVDPADNTLFEVHQYLDAASSGGGACVSGTIGSERMKNFYDWLRANKKKGFLGEFAGTNTSTCNAAVKNMMEDMMKNADVLQGWLWWAAGPGWGDYALSIEPQNGKDRPQMSLLTPFLTR